MAENEEKPGGEEQTPEQRDQQSAEKYRSQFSKSEDGGDKDAQLGDKPKEGEGAKEKDAKLGIDEKPQRPSHIPEKFWDAEKGEVRVEELAKSYSELEKNRGKPPAKADEGGEGDDEGGDDEGADPVAAVATEIASHREKLTEKLLAGTALEDADYAPFEKVGFGREDIDAFIAGQQALGQLAEMAVHAEVGGKDEYAKMIEWARTAYSKEEIAVYDRDVYSTDAGVRLAAARGLAARYAQSVGRDGKSVTNKGGKPGADGYRSKAEMTKDMQDPRYAKDPAFRTEVQRKVQAAVASGVNLRL